MSLFNTTVEWFVPEGLAEQNPEEHRRARLSVVLLLALFPMNPIAATTYALLGLDLFVLPVLACGLLMAACPFIIRATGSYKLGGAIALINLMAAITLISLARAAVSSLSFHFASRSSKARQKSNRRHRCQAGTPSARRCTTPRGP